MGKVFRELLATQNLVRNRVERESVVGTPPETYLQSPVSGWNLKNNFHFQCSTENVVHVYIWGFHVTENDCIIPPARLYQPNIEF